MKFIQILGQKVNNPEKHGSSYIFRLLSGCTSLSLKRAIRRRDSGNCQYINYVISSFHWTRHLLGKPAANFNNNLVGCIRGFSINRFCFLPIIREELPEETNV